MSELPELPEQKLYKPFFDLVVNKDNWKYPIDAIVEAPTTSPAFDTWCRVVHEAIAWYAGGQSSIESVGYGKVHVKAPGYYALIGA